MTRLSQLIETFESLLPSSGAEDWDSVGLVAGSPKAEVSRVLLTVDVTSELISESVGKFDLLLAHHPPLLRGIKTASEATSKGALLASAIKHDLAIFAAHTNADIVSDGVSDSLAKALGIVDGRPLVASHGGESGHGRIGSLTEVQTLGEFAQRVARILPSTASGIRVAGDFSKMIRTAAVCGGAGDAFITQAMNNGADVYLTADLRHHVIQESLESSKVTGRQMAFIDVGHWASEWPWLEVAANQLRRLHPEIHFEVSDLNTDSFDFVVTQ